MKQAAMLRGAMLAPASRPLSGGEPQDLAAAWEQAWSEALHQAALRREGQARSGWVLPGALDTAGRELASLYRPLVEHRPVAARPWVIGHLGQSLDGFIATHGGDSRYVTGEADLDHMHRLRALADAVIVGAGTVAIDDPLLTTRRVPGPHPARAVLDPLARVPRTARVLRGDDAPTLWLVDERWCDRARSGGVAARVLPVPGLLGADGALDAAAAVTALAAEGLAV
ncbi:MAG: RibD family protein, partial [Rubrivivax sp.]|nr:RibD family protein [Rubrivivax sp.]